MIAEVGVPEVIEEIVDGVFDSWVVVDGDTFYLMAAEDLWNRGCHCAR